jgi:hypothetical protein
VFYSVELKATTLTNKREKQMKLLVRRLLITAMLTWLITPIAQSANSVTTPPIEVSAEIQALMQLKITIHDGESLSDPTVTLMNFDKLVLDETTSNYSASHVFTIEAEPKTSSREYVITQTGTRLTAPAGDMLPVGCLIVTPNAINETPKTGAIYGIQQTWVSANAVVYTSNNKGQRDVINARYTVSSDPSLGSYDVIDVDQQGGLYTATVTYTLTLK